ncbi:MAG: hypothetical protein JWP51_1069 [Bradyrhizobium sp.]|jgi:hypothetical protein|nr:hypothetical protein [Bradyrhizobium sp.]
MNTQKSGPAVLFFYAYALTLSALLLCRDVSLQHASTQSTELAMLAWLLINRRRLTDD